MMKIQNAGRHGEPDKKIDRALSWNEVQRITGLSRASAYRGRRNGTFPAARRLSANRIAWLESDILDWLRSRPVTSAGQLAEVSDE